MAKKKDVTRALTHSLDIEELACVITGLDYDEIEADTEIIESELYHLLGIDLAEFQELIGRLLPLISIGISPITNVTYKGFTFPDKDIWIIKTPISL